MKFEKFVKLVGSRGIVLTSEKFRKFFAVWTGHGENSGGCKRRCGNCP